eukprot:1543331-Lingulodinium_polyedra.AAC.1
MRSCAGDRGRRGTAAAGRELSAHPGALALLDHQLHARSVLAAGIQECRTDAGCLSTPRYHVFSGGHNEAQAG